MSLTKMQTIFKIIGEHLKKISNSIFEQNPDASVRIDELASLLIDAGNKIIDIEFEV